MKKAPLRAAVMIALATLPFAACSSAFGSTTHTSSTTAHSAAAQTMQAGVLTVAEDEDYPPEIYKTSSGALAGYDYDMLNAIGKQMGLKVNFVPVQFAQAIIGLKGRQYDVYPGLYITKPRLAAVGMVPYFETGDLVVSKKGGVSPQAPGALCGLSVGIIEGASAIQSLQAQSKACVAKGKGQITVHAYPSDPDASQAVLSGAVQVQMTGATVAHNIVKKLPSLTTTSTKLFFPSVVALGVNKGNTSLAGALSKAVSALVHNGTFTAIYKKYGLLPVNKKDLAAAKQTS